MTRGDLVRVVHNIATPYVEPGTIGTIMSDDPKIFEDKLEMLFVFAGGKHFLEYRKNLELLNAQD
jgi:hypothetical protein